MRSSMIELASISRPLGSSAASMSASENGCTGSRGMADHERRRLEASGARCARGRCGRTGSPGARRRSGPGPGTSQSSTSSAMNGTDLARDRAGRACHLAACTGSPNVSANSSGVNARRAGRDRVVQHRHLDDHPAQALGRERGHLERDVGAQRGAADHRLLELEVVEQRHGLPGELGHRVAPHLPRAVRVAVAERVERDHPVAAPGQVSGQRRLHLLREQQARHQDRRARALAVDRVGELAARRSGNAPSISRISVGRAG